LRAPRGGRVDLDDVCKILAANRAQADEAARMTPEVRRAATEAGLWSLVAPREVGGSELSLPELAAVFERLGAADPAFAWIAMNSTTTELMGGFLAPDVAEQVLAGADGPFGLSGSPTDIDAARVEGGWRVNARFRFMTGSADARWCTAVGLDAQAPDAGMFAFVMPMSDLSVTDNWADASAMRGTGSNAVTGQGVFVPDERVVSLARPPRIDRPLFWVSHFVTLWMPCAAMAIGALRTAMEGCVELVANKTSAGPDRKPYVETWRVQQTLADSAATIDCLSGGLRAVAEDLWAAATAGHSPSAAVRARWWSLLCYVFDTARHSASDLYRSSGSAVYGTRNPVERSMRDIHAIATTFEQPPVQALRAEAGRVLAGKDFRNPIF
jgi:alkylation response protein AidB-like acyl-CoA dehydrogenase